VSPPGVSCDEGTGLGLVARVVKHRRGLTRQGRRPAAPDHVKRDFTAEELPTSSGSEI
jgi:hypothetical protein